MTGEIGFFFPVDGSDQWDGFNHPGIEHFAGAPYAAVGREVPQNVLDATETAPARIEVRLIEVAVTDVPDIKSFKTAVGRCTLVAKNENDKARVFFDRANTILNKSKIKVLQIRDSNTTGVRGPCKNGSPYYALLKASGQSKKPGETSIGSFGIGKFAPYAVSDLRTVFVSTIWQDEHDEWHQYVQGKAILMSHYCENGVTHQGVGFWGVKDKCFPVDEMGHVPAWLQRATSPEDYAQHAGTTLSILGFDGSKGWQQQIAAAIAESFFGAINYGKLEVSIQDLLTITRDTLPSIFLDESIVEAIGETRGEPEKYHNSKLFLDCLSGRQGVIEETTENLHLGRCVMKLIVKEGLPKRVAILRDGMLITTEPDRLRRFGEFKEFVAVVECQSEKGNELLRKMEPPKHDDFEPDRLPTPAETKKGKTALRELADWVRKMLKRHAQDPASAVTTIDELKDFFPDEQGDGEDGRDQERNPAGKIVIRLRKLPKQERPSIPLHDDEASGDDGDGIDGSNTGQGIGPEPSPQPAPGPQPGPRPKPQPAPLPASSGGKSAESTHTRVSLENVRAVVLDARRRRVSFTPNHTGLIRISLQDSGADTNHKLQPKSSSAGAVNGGLIEGLSVLQGMRTAIDIELESDFFGTMRVAADAV